MVPSNDVAIPTLRNRLLAALPAEVLGRLLARLEPVELSFREVLQPPGRPSNAVYFPESGIISMLAYLNDGDVAEVGLIGRDGMVGLPLLLGATHDDLEGMVQISGTALRMDAGVFQKELERSPALHALLLRYALVHHGQVARTAACNGRHQMDQRLARWLLMVHDRLDGDELSMTHELLAIMLGVRRSGISMVAGAFQQARLIRYRRARIKIIDRPGLESVACECYGVARRAHDALFGEEAVVAAEPVLVDQA